MAKLHAKVIRVLRSALGDLDDWLEELPEGRVAGAIVSSRFDGMDFAARQRKLSRILKSALTPADLEKVGAIATLARADVAMKT